MSTTNDTILPLIDRRAPLIERVQKRMDEDNGANEIEKVGYSVGKELGAIATSEDKEAAEEAAVRLQRGLIEGVAEELGKDPEKVEEEDMENVLSAIELVESEREEE